MVWVDGDWRWGEIGPQAAIAQTPEPEAVDYPPEAPPPGVEPLPPERRRMEQPQTGDYRISALLRAFNGNLWIGIRQIFLLVPNRALPRIYQEFYKLYFESSLCFYKFYL